MKLVSFARRNFHPSTTLAPKNELFWLARTIFRRLATPRGCTRIRNVSFDVCFQQAAGQEVDLPHIVGRNTTAAYFNSVTTFQRRKQCGDFNAPALLQESSDLQNSRKSSQMP